VRARSHSGGATFCRDTRGSAYTRQRRAFPSRSTAGPWPASQRGASARGPSAMSDAGPLHPTRSRNSSRSSRHCVPVGYGLDSLAELGGEALKVGT
jgi:hypothetical protein